MCMSKIGSNETDTGGYILNINPKIEESICIGVYKISRIQNRCTFKKNTILL